MEKTDVASPLNLLLHGVYLGLYGFVKYLPFPFFHYLRYAVIRLFSRGMKSTHIMDGVTIYFPWRVTMGARSSLNQGVIVDGTGGITIGEGVRIAPYCTLNSVDHTFSDPATFIMDQGYNGAPIVIEDDVWIGAGSQICKGVTIGKGSVVGAGSVVTRDIPPNSVAVGAPCRPIKKRA